MQTTPAAQILQDADPRPKRSYTSSDRQREASRRNIRKAQRAARLLMKTPGYQPSPQRLAATRANLERAHEVRRRDSSYRYTSCFRDGLSAVSLERSLAMAGESLDDFRAHLERFQRAFAWRIGESTPESAIGEGPACGGQRMDALATLRFPLGPAPGLAAGAYDGARGRGISKLASALGQAVWRRLRVFRTLPDWEMFAVCHSLRRLIRERSAGEELTAARLADWAAELVDYTLADARLHAWGKACALDNRVEALACRLLLERGEDGFHLRACPSPVVSNFEQRPVEVLSNPLRSAPSVEAALAGRRATVADPAGWQPFGSSLPAVSSLCFAAGLDLPWLQDTLLPRGRRQEAEGEAAVPRCFEDFLKLVNEALGEGQGSAAGIGSRESSNCRLPIADCQLKSSVVSCPSSVGVRAGAGSWESIDDYPAPARDPELRDLAEALWDRLQFFRRQREQETGELEMLSQAYITSLATGAGPEPLPALPALSGPLARKLVDVLARGEQAFSRVQGPELRVKRALYALLVKRHGERPEFLPLRPPPPDTLNLLVRALLLDSMGRKAEAEALLELSEEIEASGARGRGSEAGGQGSGGRGRGPEVRSQKSEVRSQKLEVKDFCS